MKLIIYFLFVLLLISGCSKKPQVPQKPAESGKVLFNDLPQTRLIKSDFNQLPNWSEENYKLALESFVNSCRSSKTQNIYQQLCKQATDSQDPKDFLQSEFIPYEIKKEAGINDGILTGYYEPELKGSLLKTSKFKYPIYETPDDLINVDLSSIYPELKNYRLRGRLQGNKLIPYYTRKEESLRPVNARIICYTDSKVDLFFLEIQGSGRVTLQDGQTIFVGYDNQNGHAYRSIGKYLVQIKAFKSEQVSLQSIKDWLIQHPERMDEVLNYNKSLVYFRKKAQAASGALGLCLTPKRSIAVDRRYIPLGSMLYLSAKIKNENVSKVVMAEDTGGAIKGAVRADFFTGYGEEARDIASGLKSPLKLWILLPKNKKEIM